MLRCVVVNDDDDDDDDDDDRLTFRVIYDIVPHLYVKCTYSSDHSGTFLHPRPTRGPQMC